MRYAILIPVFVLALAMTAHAHMLRHPARMTASQQLSYAKRTIAHASATISWARWDIRRVTRAHGRTIDSPDPVAASAWSAHLDRAKLLLRSHLYLRSYGRRQLAEALAGVHPAIPHRSAWLCIHGYEGSWTDAGDPYWGGLQMDRGFMRTYGADMERRFHGFANVWPVWAQMAVAERAWHSRGFYPWPNTARYCGLL